MKNIIIGIDKYQAEWMFAPIRSRQEALSVLMKTIKILLLNVPPPQHLIVGEVVLKVSKMSRIFFLSEKKIYSIAFPFIVSDVDGQIGFRSHSHSDVNHRVSSEILSLLESPTIFLSSDVIAFADPIDEFAQKDAEIWALFRDLLLAEEGYIRYDYDVDRQNGHFHPTNHFDIFYSSNVTFKLGLDGPAGVEEMVDMLDSATMCHYVNSVDN